MVTMPEEVRSYIENNPRPDPELPVIKTKSWFNELMDAMNDTWNLKALDTHVTPYLNGLKPDISIFYVKGDAYTPMFVRTVVELKPFGGEGKSFGDANYLTMLMYLYNTLKVDGFY